MTQLKEPAWKTLLDIAIGHLRAIGATSENWTWGGGTVLTLRHRHRISCDIDLFLDDPQYLAMLSPRLNDAIAQTVDHYVEQANHLRCFVAGVGEIDHLQAAPVIDRAPKIMEFAGYGAVQTMPDREILAQKLYYRATGFTGRDLFDFATVTSLHPALLDDPELKKLAAIRKNALQSRLGSDDLKEAYEGVTIHDETSVRMSFVQAQTAMRQWLDAM